MTKEKVTAGVQQETLDASMQSVEGLESESAVHSDIPASASAGVKGELLSYIIRWSCYWVKGLIAVTKTWPPHQSDIKHPPSLIYCWRKFFSLYLSPRFSHLSDGSLDTALKGRVVGVIRRNWRQYAGSLDSSSKGDKLGGWVPRIIYPHFFLPVLLQLLLLLHLLLHLVHLLLLLHCSSSSSSVCFISLHGAKLAGYTLFPSILSHITLAQPYATLPSYPFRSTVWRIIIWLLLSLYHILRTDFSRSFLYSIFCIVSLCSLLPPIHQLFVSHPFILPNLFTYPSLFTLFLFFLSLFSIRSMDTDDLTTNSSKSSLNIMIRYL